MGRWQWWGGRGLPNQHLGITLTAKQISERLNCSSCNEKISDIKKIHTHMHSHCRHNCQAWESSCETRKSVCVNLHTERGFAHSCDRQGKAFVSISTQREGLPTANSRLKSLCSWPNQVTVDTTLCSWPSQAREARLQWTQLMAKPGQRSQLTVDTTPGQARPEKPADSGHNSWPSQARETRLQWTQLLAKPGQKSQLTVDTTPCQARPEKPGYSGHNSWPSQARKAS